MCPTAEKVNGKKKVKQVVSDKQRRDEDTFLFFMRWGVLLVSSVKHLLLFKKRSVGDLWYGDRKFVLLLGLKGAIKESLRNLIDE